MTKRFQPMRIIDNIVKVYDSETDGVLDLNTVCEKLNDQQATIQRMKHSLNTIYKAFEEHYGYDMRNAVWLIDELSYDEIVDELHIAETDSKNRKEASMYWKKKCDEQQATIQQLQTKLQAVTMLKDLWQDIHKEYNIYSIKDFEELLNGLKKENEQLRLELETHKHPLWSTREAEKKVNKLVDSLADEIKKNGLLNEELNQLRIENMRLKKKRGDEMSEKNCEHCKHFQLDGMFGLWCEKDHDWTLVNENCSDFER